MARRVGFVTTGPIFESQPARLVNSFLLIGLGVILIPLRVTRDHVVSCSYKT